MQDTNPLTTRVTAIQQERDSRRRQFDDWTCQIVAGCQKFSTPWSFEPTKDEHGNNALCLVYTDDDGSKKRDKQLIQLVEQCTEHHVLLPGIINMRNLTPGHNINVVPIRVAVDNLYSATNYIAEMLADSL